MTLVKVNNPVARTFDGFVNDLFDDFPTKFGGFLRNEPLTFPPVNIVEKADAYYLEIAAPGMDKADFNVKLDGDVLTISAERKEESKQEKDREIRREFNYRSFKRSFTLDDKVNVGDIAAKYENGILKIALPKREEVKAVSKDITIH